MTSLKLDAKVVVTLLAAFLTLSSKTAAERDPIARMLSALGGSMAIGKLSSLSVEAECTGPSGPFQTSVQSLRPDRVHFLQTADDGTTRIWSTPARTWTMDGGKTKFVSEAVRAFVRGHEFHLLLFEVESRFPKREEADEELVQGRAFTRVRMTDEGGHPATLLLDRTSFLPRSLELNPPGAEGPVRISFNDWRRIGDLLYFESFQLTEGPDRSFTYRYTKISPNSVEPGLFAQTDGQDSPGGTRAP